MTIKTKFDLVNGNYDTLSKFKKYFSDNGILWLLALPGLIYVLLFMYVPMAGLVVIFKNYNFHDGIFGSPWVGFKNFEFFFYSFNKAWTATRNTIFLNLLFIVFGTVVSVALAIMFNEIRSKYFMRITQSLTIIPYFISWIVVGNMLLIIINYDKGILNKIFTAIGWGKIDFNSDPTFWPIILAIVFIWKIAGYTTIIFYAVLSNLDKAYYEAAEIDGANILQSIFFISIPFLKPTIVMLTLLSIGRIFYGDLTMMIGLTNLNPMLIPTTEIIDSFVYRSVIKEGQFAMASAVGLYQSVFGLIMVFLANHFAGKFNEDYKIF